MGASFIILRPLSQTNSAKRCQLLLINVKTSKIMANDQGAKTGGAAPATKKGLSLMEKLSRLSHVEFDIVDLVSQKDRDGNFIAILTLAQPIPYVRGSQEVGFNGKQIAITQSDVTEIKVHQNDFNEDFWFDKETNTGGYSGDKLILDVSKQGQVWLRSTTFAASGNEYRAKAQNDRLMKLVGGQAAATTATKPAVTPVATA